MSNARLFGHLTIAFGNILGVIATGAVCVMPAYSQTTYEWKGTGNNGGALWGAGETNANFWSTGAGDAPRNPGSNNNTDMGPGAVGDIVNIRNHRPLDGSPFPRRLRQQVRLQHDAGIIGGLKVGGADSADGVVGVTQGETQLAIRDSGALTIAGDLTLGAIQGGANLDAQVILDSGNNAQTATLKVQGNVVSEATVSASDLSISVNSINDVFELSGDIDSEFVRADMTTRKAIDLRINVENGFSLSGNDQELNLDLFSVMNTNRQTSASFNGVASAEIAPKATGETLILDANDIVVGSVTGNSRELTGTLNVNGASVSAEEIVVGRTNSQSRGRNNAAKGTGVLNVGLPTDLGATEVFTSNNLKVGVQSENDVSSTQIATGIVNVDRAGTVLDVNLDLELGLNNGTGSASGTLNIDGGAVVNVGSDLLLGASGNGSGIVNLRNGRLFVNEDFMVGTGDSAFTVSGAETDINISGDFFGNQSSFDMNFDFNDDNSINDFSLDVAGDTNVTGATLNFLNASNLNSFNGDILLFDTLTSTGQFFNAAQGDVFGAYMLVYDYSASVGGGDLGVALGGGSNIALVRSIAVPEPGAFAILSLGLLLSTVRRRRGI